MPPDPCSRPRVPRCSRSAATRGSGAPGEVRVVAKRWMSTTCGRRLVEASRGGVTATVNRQRTRSVSPSMAGEPSAFTSELSAAPGGTTAVEHPARQLECTSLPGPRPQRSPLAISSSSTTPWREVDGDVAVEAVRGERHEHAVGLARAAPSPRARAHLLEVRRTDLFLALARARGYRQLAARGAEGVQGARKPTAAPSGSRRRGHDTLPSPGMSTRRASTAGRPLSGSPASRRT